jgi:hypothetical protein
MARTAYCRWDQCGHSLQIETGAYPARCPGCNRESMWSTSAVFIVVPIPEPMMTDPLKPWVLNEMDRRFLKSIRVAANNDHEDDAA